MQVLGQTVQGAVRGAVQEVRRVSSQGTLPDVDDGYVCEVGVGRTPECSVRASERRGHPPIIPLEALARVQRRGWVEPFVKGQTYQVGMESIPGEGHGVGGSGGKS